MYEWYFQELSKRRGYNGYGYDDDDDNKMRSMANTTVIHGSLFKLMDTSDYGRVSITEFTNFYLEYGPLIGLSYSRLHWNILYTQVMSRIDVNRNNKQEAEGKLFSIQYQRSARV